MKLTPEQTKDLVAWSGSQRKAAAVAGAHESTVRYWLDPEKKRAKDKRYSQSEKGRAAHARATSKYEATLKGRIAVMRREQNEMTKRRTEVIENGYL